MIILYSLCILYEIDIPRTEDTHEVTWFYLAFTSRIVFFFFQSEVFCCIYIDFHIIQYITEIYECTFFFYIKKKFISENKPYNKLVRF